MHESESAGEFFAKAAVAMLAIGVVGLTLSSFIMMIIADGKVQYCYTHYYSGGGSMPHHTLYGFRPWRPDSTIGTYATLDEAVAAAAKVNCKLNGAESTNAQ